jgi:hypothetical protein
MAEKFDLSEYPPDWKGRRTYVYVAGQGVIPVIYTYFQGGNRQLLPEYGGPDYEDKAHGSGIMVMRDIGEYKSVVDGTNITSRSHHREHIRRHDLVEVGNERVRQQEIKPQNVRADIQRTLHQLRDRG